jgi:hypothetical protein
MVNHKKLKVTSTWICNITREECEHDHNKDCCECFVQKQHIPTVPKKEGVA